MNKIEYDSSGLVCITLLKVSATPAIRCVVAICALPGV